MVRHHHRRHCRVAASAPIPALRRTAEHDHRQKRRALTQKTEQSQRNKRKPITVRSTQYIQFDPTQLVCSERVR